MKTFKSERAAKMAYTKAENAWKAKRDEASAAKWKVRDTMREQGSMDSAEYDRLTALEKSCEEEAKALFDVMRAVYEQATAQKFFVSAWHFGTNPTRDLIAANMD